MKYFLFATRNFADFYGRSGRREFWWYNLMLTIIFIALMSYIYLTSNANDDLYSLMQEFSAGWFVSIKYAFLLPTYGVYIRRLHDAGLSGWWGLLALIPLIGVLILMLLALKKSQPENEYGQVPDYDNIDRFGREMNSSL